MNRIKNRDGYRPVAPIVLETGATRLFGCQAPSPYMLFFHQVADPALQAVTHADASARTQTVTECQNAPMFHLLTEFRRLTGYGVLCNTSLNFLDADSPIACRI